MKILFTALLILFTTSSTSATPIVEKLTPFIDAKLYEIGSDRKKVLFSLQVKQNKDRSFSRSEFKNTKGEVVTTEEIHYNSDGSLSVFKISHPLMKQSGEISIKGKKVYFSYSKTNDEGKIETDTDDEDLTDDFVIGPMIRGYVQKRWATIAKGDDVDFRIAVVDRQETVGFKIFKDKETELSGKKVWVLKMKPTSFIIAAIVDPLYFTFTADGKTLLEVKGRTLPKVMKDGKWQDVDVDGVYNFHH